MDQITYRSPSFFDDLAASTSRHVHIILIATKPDIIKQIPLYNELKKRGHLVLLGHTGQHYDENLSGGMLKEFGVEPDFNLNVRGAMHEIVSQIIGRLGYIIGKIKEGPAHRSLGEGGKIVIPYVHGDTTTAMAASNAGYCHGFAAVHVEAGIRTLTPNYEDFGLRDLDLGKTDNPMSYVLSPKSFDVDAWRVFLMDPDNWERGSQEPFPEQFNTRCSEAGSGIHLAPVELDAIFMRDEGFAEDRIFVVGNSVVDATNDALARAKTSTIFDRYPALKDGDFVRFCIHRRENCISETRFKSIYNAMKGLIEDGRTVLLISLFQTEAAFDRFGLRTEVETLVKNHPNFIYSPVWAEYVDVIAAMNKAAVCATDSGSMQEEMNVLGVPCVTLRFGSDRSESAMIGGNIIAPPVDGDVIKKIIEYAWDNADMQNAKKIYGQNVSARCIDAVESVLKKGEVLRGEEERLGL